RAVSVWPGGDDDRARRQYPAVAGARGRAGTRTRAVGDRVEHGGGGMSALARIQADFQAYVLGDLPTKADAARPSLRRWRTSSGSRLASAWRSTTMPTASACA